MKDWYIIAIIALLLIGVGESVRIYAIAHPSPMMCPIQCHSMRIPKK